MCASDMGARTAQWAEVTMKATPVGLFGVQHEMFGHIEVLTL